MALKLRPMDRRPLPATDLNSFFVYAYLDTWMKVLRRKSLVSWTAEEDFILSHLGFSSSRAIADIVHDYSPANKTGYNNPHLHRMAKNYRKIMQLDKQPQDIGKSLAQNGNFVSEIAALADAAESGKKPVRGLCLKYEGEFISSALLRRAASHDDRLFLKMVEEWDMSAELSEDILWVAADCSEKLADSHPGGADDPYKKRLLAKTRFFEKRAICAALKNGLGLGFVPGYIKWHQQGARQKE